MVEVRQNILKKNDMVARALRERFQHERVFVASFVSSPGSGKTSLLEKILTALSPIYRVGALVGDLATDNDALRLAGNGVPAKQITTGTVCHLDASMVQKALREWNMPPFDFLFIENVGNLVCPSCYDLGESLRLVLMSVTEGEDKPLKYPTIFNSADIVVVTKIDLAKVVECDVAALERNVRAVRPEMPIFYVSAKTGEGMTEYLAFLRQKFQQSRIAAATPMPALD
jgi:hydrogenase nickel incorporation protein HypB